VLTGEVNRTGPQTLSFSRGEGQEGNPFATVTRAIQQAGGITELADIRNVQVRRTNANGTQDVLIANLWNLIQEGEVDQDIQLVDGDSIHIPEVKDPVTAEYGQIAKATFSPDAITVRVIGEVNGPGSIQLKPNAPFTEAIIAAGGITNDGDWRRVELYRISPNGNLTRRKLVADLDLPPNEDTNPGLRDRDFIVVRASFGANILNAVTRTLGDIVTPITLLDRLTRN
jgi:polysaccharide export outer membrane protein